MKKKSNTRVFSVLVALSAFVAIMCMFADIFSEKVGSPEGNIFVAMFGMHNSDYQVVWPLVISFCLLMLLVLTGFMGFMLGDAGKKIIPLIEIVLGIAAGVLFFFAIRFFYNANAGYCSGFDTYEHFLNAHAEITLGAGSICVIVFSFFAAGLALLNFFAEAKNK